MTSISHHSIYPLPKLSSTSSKTQYSPPTNHKPSPSKKKNPSGNSGWRWAISEATTSLKRLGAFSREREGAQTPLIALISTVITHPVACETIFHYPISLYFTVDALVELRDSNYRAVCDCWYHTRSLLSLCLCVVYTKLITDYTRTIRV